MSTVFCENREEKMAWCVLTNVQIHVFCVYIFSSTNIKEILHIMHLPFVSELASTAYSDAQVNKYPATLAAHHVCLWGWCF